MEKQLNLEELMPDTDMQQRVSVLLVRLGHRYGKEINLSDFYPQYKNVYHAPPPAVKKIAEELYRELQAANRLGEGAKAALTLEEKLMQYKNVVELLLRETAKEDLTRAATWENAKRLIGNGIAEGKGAAPVVEDGAKDELFLKFKAAYPRKQSMGKAEKWFKTHKPGAELVDKMLEAIERQKKTLQWQENNGQFIPHPYTWLNAKGWENEVPADVELQEESNVLKNVIGKVPIYKKREVKENE